MHQKLTLAVLFLTVASACPAASILVNGSFEAVQGVPESDASASPFYQRSFSSTPGWTQYLDGVDLIHNSYTQAPTVLVQASDGSQFLDMNQAGALGGIRQVVSVTNGASYNLSLDVAAWAQNAIGGTIGYELYDPASSDVLASGSYQDSVGGSWITRELSATATSTLLGVRIFGIAAAQAGMGLDNVRLEEAEAAISGVPEPSTVGLLAAGALGLFAARRKKLA